MKATVTKARPIGQAEDAAGRREVFRCRVASIEISVEGDEADIRNALTLGMQAISRFIPTQRETPDSHKPATPRGE